MLIFSFTTLLGFFAVSAIGAIGAPVGPHAKRASAAPVTLPAWTVDGRFFQVNRDPFVFLPDRLEQRFVAKYAHNITTIASRTIGAPLVLLKDITTSVITPAEHTVLRNAGLTAKSIDDAASNNYMMYSITKPICFVYVDGALFLTITSRNWVSTRKQVEREAKELSPTVSFSAKDWSTMYATLATPSGEPLDEAERPSWEQIRDAECLATANMGDQLANDRDPQQQDDGAAFTPV